MRCLHPSCLRKSAGSVLIRAAVVAKARSPHVTTENDHDWIQNCCCSVAAVDGGDKFCQRTAAELGDIEPRCLSGAISGPRCTEWRRADTCRQDGSHFAPRRSPGVWHCPRLPGLSRPCGNQESKVRLKHVDWNAAATTRRRILANGRAPYSDPPLANAIRLTTSGTGVVTKANHPNGLSPPSTCNSVAYKKIDRAPTIAMPRLIVFL